MKPIKFKCPYGNHDALYYGDNFAGCLIHGRLLYTDIPRDVKIFKRDWKAIFWGMFRK